MSPQIKGADNVISWFGSWPSFHDAEILALHLDRKGASWLKLHTWLRAGNATDKDGHYILDKHAVITFQLTGITDIELRGFNHQNVIAGLEIEPLKETFRLFLSPCFGVGGFLEAEDITVDVAPGKPEP